MTTASVWDDISRPHIDSFNYLLDFGLYDAVKAIPSKQFELETSNKDRLTIKINQVSISPPVIAGSSAGLTSASLGRPGAGAPPLYPRECRERGLTYSGRLHASVSLLLNEAAVAHVDTVIAQIPVMVKSKCCNLWQLSSEKLVSKGEEPTEFGGYFIINGNERIIRLLVQEKRNYPVALCRPSWRARRDFYSEFGVTLRSVDDCHTASNMTLHYLTNGTAELCLAVDMRNYFVSVVLVLKALCNVSDKFIYETITFGNEDDLLKGGIKNMLGKSAEDKLFGQDDVLEYLGRNFRVTMREAPWLSDKEVGRRFLDSCVCIHLKNNSEKFNFLIYMTQKLFALVQQKCTEDSADNPMFQEAMLPGHFYLCFLKEKLVRWTGRLQADILKRFKKNANLKHLPQIFSQTIGVQSSSLTRSFQYLLATGNLANVGDLAMKQRNGLTIIGEKLNYLRYIAHFRSIHRGAFFATMRTTTVRKLRPESWGFSCPVHTPDGTPCGLLNHLSATCRAVAYNVASGRLADVSKLVASTLRDFGFFDLRSNVSSYCMSSTNLYPVMLDGKLFGHIPDSYINEAITELRRVKVFSTLPEFNTAEIALVPRTGCRTLYPGLFVFVHAGRLIRPVRNLALKRQEWIGVYEQAFLQVSVTPEEARRTKPVCSTTHQELSPWAILSMLGQMTPYSDHNQSPRNMYQCQMGKQTMGMPGYCLRIRGDNKMYNLQTPQSPLVRTVAYDAMDIDKYPLGTNAIVAVISYTGYDMEDAMILNKASYERGFAHGQVWKNDRISLTDNNCKTQFFQRDPATAALVDHLDRDGLPHRNSFLQDGTPYYCFFDSDSEKYVTKTFRSTEFAYVDHVKVIPAQDESLNGIRHVVITLRIPRNPSIGDKFASRHGQKGICSYLWPTENMPFTEFGMVPDIIFNPHGFPSRMTIGMMIESMAGKAGMMHAARMDATPFVFSEDQPAISYFGDLLVKAGFNYHGNEAMYSGLDGRQFQVDIFFGVIYYQRLRHMVADKFQVRTTGAVDVMTHQPIHGRKRGGGVRLGEMERDSLIAHGAAFLLQDRLLNNSDRDTAWICETCGDLSSVWPVRMCRAELTDPETGAVDSMRRQRCRLCGGRNGVRNVTIPYVLRYLVSELASFNIRLKFDVKSLF